MAHHFLAGQSTLVTQVCGYQCDQMVRLFFNIWPFPTMQISPIMSQVCQSRLSILPNKK